MPYGIMQPNHNGIAYKKMYGNKLEWDTKIKTELAGEIPTRRPWETWSRLTLLIGSNVKLALW